MGANKISKHCLSQGHCYNYTVVLVASALLVGLHMIGNNNDSLQIPQQSKYDRTPTDCD